LAALLLRGTGRQPLALPADRLGAVCELRLSPLGPALADHPLLRDLGLDGTGTAYPVLDPARLAALAQAPARAAARQRGVRVLVVDDSSTVRNAMARILRGEGIALDTAADGRDALARLERERYALVVTDLEMPNMDGIELLEVLRGDERWRAQPVVVCSSRQPGEALARLGVAGFLAKPFEAAALLRLVRPFTASSGGGRATPF
jgi:CheY-like chemotaxis protein